jgi:hypothetical protein
MSPRIRTLKPDIWQDSSLGSVSPGARLLFVGLITQADDEGRFRAEVALLRAQVFPWDVDQANGQLPGMTAELDIAGWLDALEMAGLIRLYTVRGQRYGDLPTWSKHQRIKYPSPSPLPAFGNRNKPERTPPDAGDSAKAPEVLPQASPTELRGEELRGRTVVEQSPARPGTTRIDTVWSAYLQHHPKAVLTAKRRKLIADRLRDYEPERLVAAIAGNHLDPHCNGDNDRNQTYHGIGLILRDAEHIERYEAIANADTNGGLGGESRLARARRVSAEREGAAQ